SIKWISALASSLGNPIIMDEITPRMCAKGDGRLNFPRVLIEVKAGKELKKEIEVFVHDNKSCMFKEKEDTGIENSSGRNEIRGNTRGGPNEIHDDNVDKTKRKSTMNESNVKCNKEKTSSSIMNASTSNRYTLLNELVGDEQIIPYLDERKIVDEYMNKENEGDNIECQG
ncbi:hypothetical protein Tco_1512450, partial [Tanacetum coccineum]